MSIVNMCVSVSNVNLLDILFVDVLKLILVAGALFNQLTIWISSWRRNYLHKKGNRVKVLDLLSESLTIEVSRCTFSLSFCCFESGINLKICFSR